MIVQQVNLYQDSFKPKQPDLRLYLMIAVVFMFFIGFSLANVYLMGNLRSERESVAETGKKLAAAQQLVKQLQSQIPKQEIDTALAAELKQWQKKLADANTAIAILGNNDSVRSQGFSAYFSALANQPVSEVWLTVIHFDTRQHLINFEGSTFKTAKIPHFLQQLQKEPVFHGRTFARLQVEKSTEIPKQMNFKLSTHLEPVKKDDAK